MASGTSSVSGLASGIDWETTVQQLMQIERRHQTLLTSRKSENETKLKLWTQIYDKIAALQSAMESLDLRSEFAVKAASSSDTGILGITAGAGAAEGAHAVEVRQLARAHRLAAQGWADKNITGVGDSGGDLVLQTGDKTITIADADLSAATTLEQLARLINNAPDNEDLVTASIVDDGSASNPYRLVITANRSGVDNRVVVSTNPTSLDFAVSRIDTAELQSGWSGTSAVTTAGTYTGTTNKTYTFTVAGSGAQAVGAADITLNWADSLGNTGSVIVPAGYGGGNLVVADGVELSLAAGDLVGGQSFDVDVFTPELTAAQDALLAVDGIYMSKATNTVTDVLEGVTLNLLAAESGTTVDISITNDKTAVRAKIQSFVDAYNAAIGDLNTFSSYDEKNKIAAPLLGDGYLTSTRGRLTSVVARALGGLALGARFNNLSAVGITTTTGGKLSIDSTKLDDALDNHFEDVVKLFTQDFVANDSKIAFVAGSAWTTPGEYAVEVNYDAAGAITSATIGGHAATVDGTLLKAADDSDLKGLVLNFTSPGSGPGTVSTTFRYSKGIAGTIAAEAQLINDDETGPIHFARDGINDVIESLDRQISTWDDRLKATEARLRQQFLNLETIISKMRNQSSFLSAGL